jgi:hypothetical protein
VPWKPPSTLRNDARLNPYRSRGGTINDSSGRSGVVYVLTVTWWTRVGGHLWWRTYSSPYELVAPWILFPTGEVRDYVLPAQDIASLVADWERGFLGVLNDQALTVEWLDDEGSVRVRSQLGIPDQQGN